MFAKKELSDEERAAIKAKYEALTQKSSTAINDPNLAFDSPEFKVVRIGLHHKESWPLVQAIIKQGFHISGVTGNGTGMNAGFVLLERDL